jgi:hypothetical protein
MRNARDEAYHFVLPTLLSDEIPLESKTEEKQKTHRLRLVCIFLQTIIAQAYGLRLISSVLQQNNIYFHLVTF